MTGETTPPRKKRQHVTDSEEESTHLRAKRQQVERVDSTGPAENEEDEFMRKMEEYDPEADGDSDIRGNNFIPAYERGKNGYVAGSVVRIKMNNFMTYDHVEFRPGPHLNMILGPNGTGKSSIAASIAIGLAFPPKVMGRANEVKSYVKQGHEDAQLEIELMGKNGQSNPVICRKFNRYDEKSTWQLNGEPSTRTKITELVKSFGVQANNLCSFLPQDKVAEFAQMAPVTVLKETMRAAGDPRLTKWHEKLIEKGRRVTELEDSLSKHINARNRHQGTVDNLAPDVEHVLEREKREFEVKVLTNLLRVSEHKVLKEEAAKFNIIREKLQQKVKSHEDRRQPLKHLKDVCDTKAARAQNKHKTSLEQHVDSLIKMRKFDKDCQNLASKADEINDELGALRRKIENNEKQKAVLRNNMVRCQAILDEPRENHEEEIKEKKKEKFDLQQKIKDKQREKEELSRLYEKQAGELNEIDQSLKQQLDALEKLQSIEATKESAARRAASHGPSISYLLDWLEKEGHTLEAPVHKPAMISVNVPHGEYAWQVESCTSFPQRATFICESKVDYDRLLQLNSKPLPSKYIPRQFQNQRQDKNFGKVQLYLAYQEVTHETVNPRRPCSGEQLNDLGFDGFAIDYVEAAPGVIAYLQTNCRMHMVAVTQNHASRVTSSGLPMMGIKSWATKDDYTRATQSAYGSRHWNEVVQAKKNAQAFDVAVDTEAAKSAQDAIANLEQRGSDLSVLRGESKNTLDELKDAIAVLRDQCRDVDTAISDLQRSVKRYIKAQSEMEKSVSMLQKQEVLPSGDEAREKLKQKKLQNAKDRLRPLTSCMSICDKIMDECTNLIFTGFQKVQSEVNAKAILVKVNTGNTRTLRLREEYDKAVEVHTEARALMNQKWAELKAQIGDSDRKVKTEVTKRAQENVPTPCEILNELNSLKSQLEMTVNIPNNVIQRWEVATKHLETASRLVDEEEELMADLKKTLEETLSVFEPALNTLVCAVSDKFSHAFARIKCTGEVRLRKVDGDFSQWGLEIMVSYRDTDTLAVLTGYTQSGGERSLATVTYLMSLSEMSRTPFSLVDEINQGMDERAERSVHNQLVEVTCDADAGQYFLITPKLLTGLTYHPKMKILTINNGVHIPDSYDPTQTYGGLKSCILKYRRSHAITV